MPSKTSKEAPLMCPHEITGSLCDYALPMNTLPGISPELLLYISDFLAPVDLVCFAMCNRRILNVSQGQISRLSPSASKSKLSVLARLERDLPETFTCKFCQILHRCDIFTEKFSIHGRKFVGISDGARTPTCLWKWCQCSKPFYTHPSPRFYVMDYGDEWDYSDASHYISFLDIKLAMKGFISEHQYGISTDFLAHKQVITAPGAWYFIRISSTDAQICPNPLGMYLRVQDITFEPTPYRDHHGRSYLSWDKQAWNHFLFFFFCFWDHNHVKYPTTSKFKSLWEVIQNMKPGKAIDLSCDVCHTDIHIEFRCTDTGTALIITKWVYLGACVSDEDPFWKVHAEYGHARYSEEALSPQITRPRLNFEEMTSLSYEKLALQNLSCLQDQQYKKIMTRADPDSWLFELWNT